MISDQSSEKLSAFKPGAARRLRASKSCESPLNSYVSASAPSTMLKPFILVPLYIYPLPNAWAPLYTAISSHPSLLFQIIVNPNSGPGGPPGTYPDESYTAEISRLNSYSNTQLLGYVSTDWGRRDFELVKTDIDAYAAWAAYPEANLHIDGIFFDETPARDEDPHVTEHIRRLADHARSTLPPQTGRGPTPHVTFNPGIPAATTFYNMADTVIAFEADHKDYSRTPTDYPLATIYKGQRPKTAFIMHHFNGDEKKQEKLLDHVLNEVGVQGIFVTTSDDYNEWSKLWPHLTKTMDRAANGSGIDEGVQMLNSTKPPSWFNSTEIKLRKWFGARKA